jgi:cobalt-zinc-cadmium efflux system outer membrane protein
MRHEACAAKEGGQQVKQAALLAGLVVTGCATVPKDAGFSDVERMMAERGAPRVHWLRGGEEDRRVEERLRELLKGPLTVDSAVEVALLNNRELQAVYEDLGIAQADLVQAGLLRNPTLSASVGFPNVVAPTGLTFSVVQEFIDLFSLPLRKKVARAEFERQKFRVAHEVWRLAGEVREASLELVAAEQASEMWREVLASAEAAADLARRQHEAGNINDLDLALEQDPLTEARLSLARAEYDGIAARERLTRLLGLFGEAAGFKMEGRLPEMADGDPSLERLEAFAVEHRLDLAAARKERDNAAYALSLEKGTRFTPSVQVGLNVERASPESAWLVGPSLDVEAPIFDRGQARVAQLAALLRQSEDRYQALAVEVRSEVRAARNRLVLARSTVDYYRKIVLPLRERVVSLSQLQYNAMQIGLFQLLQVKQRQVESYRDYIAELRNYWTARSALEVSAGGVLPAAPHEGAVH